jgi:MinD superfamily P-loop ATPase
MKTKQIVILSGKGGTGKTFVSAALAWLADTPVVADCDVDAANLHLLLHPKVKQTHAFSGGKVAVVDTSRCTACGRCVEACRFQAVALPRNGAAIVDPVACEGCGVCALVCPTNAPSLSTADSGRWYESDTDAGEMVHADLFPGEENSGKLVELVRRGARRRAEVLGARWAIIDGPPGTGCAPKSATTGVDYAVLVTEPTVSGVHDLARVIDLAEFFGVPMGIVVNKSTIHPPTTRSIEQLATERSIDWLGEIPFRRAVADTIAHALPYPAAHDDDITARLRQIWSLVTARLD